MSFFKKLFGESKKTEESIKLDKTTKKFDKEETQKLIVAAIDGDIDRAREAISNGADVNGVIKGVFGFETNALHRASGKGRAKMVEFLIDNGADVDAIDPFTGGTPLTTAINERQPEIVEVLLRKGASMSLLERRSGKSILEFAKSYAESYPGEDRQKIVELLENHAANSAS